MAASTSAMEVEEPVEERVDNEDAAMENSEDEGGEEGSDDGDPGEEHEFEIIDQVESEEEEEDGDGQGENGKAHDEKRQKRDDEYDDGSSSDDLDDTELHAMLEKGIDKDTIKKQEEPEPGKPIIKHKIVLKELESDPFDILPEGWVCVTHNCGMPVYLHKETRVCTMARPYSLGNASARVHDIPISAIPCLQYRKQKEKMKAEAAAKEEEQKDGSEKPADSVDATENTTGDAKEIQESACQKEIAVSVEVSSSENLGCPIASTQSKASPRKLWVVTQESSFQKCEVDSSKEALHTGTEGYNVADMVKLKSGSGDCPVSKPQSPGEENIAVSLDTSSCSDSQNSKAVTTSGEKDSNSPVTVSSTSNGKDSTDSPPNTHVNVTSTSNSLTQHPLPAEDTDTPSKLLVSGSEKSSENGMGLTESSVTKSSDGDKKIEDDCASIEEGEIVDDDDMKDENPYSDINSDEATPKSSGIISKNPSSESVINANPAENNSTVVAGSSSEINNISHVVREEAAGSSVPSEIVTSSSNKLAAIKRKIESLKSNRKGKQRRMDNGSAVGWPTENNIAVTPLRMGVGDASNVTMNENTSEKLKAHAAGVKIKSAEERAKESLLDSNTIHKYCTGLFEFKTLEVKKYKSWMERRKHLEEKSRKNRPELPPSTKLITCPIPGNLKSEDGGENVKKREFILNPTGKSYLCILHEYMQRTLKIQPQYVFKELENSKTPYGATVTINNLEYGTGYASSKKVAKHEAAKETLKVLIPDLFKKITDQEIKRNISDLSFFDDIKVTDRRVNDLGNKVGQPSPFQLLLECLRRNFGMGNTQCEVSTKPLKNQKCEFTINVGKHSATVVARNKREGKQLAAQAILAKLHPHVPSWGSLLRLYGTSVEKPIQKVGVGPEEMNDVKSHAPNHSVLERLREEMRKLHRQKEAIQSKGKIIISSKDLPSKMSGVDL